MANTLYKLKQDTVDASYWRGFIAADGWIRDTGQVGIKLSVKDSRHLEKYASYINANTYYSTATLKGIEYEMVRVSASDKNITSYLTDIGITQAKSLTIKVKESIIDWNFIRGVFDGDGTVGMYPGSKTKAHYGSSGYYYYTAYRCNIMSGSKEFIQQMKDFITTSGIKCSIIMDKSYFKINIYKASMPLFFNLIYSDAKVYLERKRQIADTIVTNIIT